MLLLRRLLRRLEFDSEAAHVPQRFCYDIVPPRRTKLEALFGGASLDTAMEYLWDITMFVAAVALIGKGADWFLEAAVKISELTHIPKAIVGATIVSLATTLPEFSVSAIATVQDHTDMAIGNAVGSAICNIGLILGLCTLAKESPTDRDLVRRQGAAMMGAGILVYALSAGGQLSRGSGAVLLLGLLAYMSWSVKTARARRQTAMDERKVQNQDADYSTTPPLGREILLFISGAACVIVGSRLLVSSGVKLAGLLGVPEMVISLTVVAFGTSLPELVTAVTASIKGHEEMAVANVIGANIMNILWVLGGCALIRPLPLKPSPSFMGMPQTQSLDMPVMCLLMILLLGFASSRATLGRKEGGVFLGIYTAYLLILFTMITP